MAEPQHPFDVSQVPAWAWVLAVTNLLGWNGKAVFSWLARIFESNSARERKDNERAWKLSEQMRSDDKQTIGQLWLMVADLQRQLGQTQQTVDENSDKIKKVEQKADIAQALSNPEVLSRIEAQSKEPEQ